MFIIGQSKCYNTFMRFIIFLILVGIYMPRISSKTTQPSVIHKYIITYTKKFNSFDPLNADQTENFESMRMMYATPIEISENDDLTSRVLSSFKYDSKLRIITLKIDPNTKYSDGTSIAPEDVSFSIVRVAYTKPDLPVVYAIKGLKEWLKVKNPLSSSPSGIKIKGQTVTIELKKEVPHPLARFALSIFSIIPRKCVDHSTNKLKCKIPPFSGYYELETEKENGGIFSKSKFVKTIYGYEVPNKIEFEYIDGKHLLSKSGDFNNFTVATGLEFAFSRDDLSAIKTNMDFKPLSGSMLLVFCINPNVKPFDNPKCRRYISHHFRKSYKQLFDNYVKVESSLFSRLLPGYLKFEDSAKAYPLSIKDEKECNELIKSSSLSLAVMQGGNNHSLFLESINKVFKDLKLPPLKQVNVKDRRELSKLFLSGGTPFFPSFSGLWELDPEGDLKMLFSPSMHKTLQFVTQDTKLQSFIGDLQTNSGSKDRASKFKEFNNYLLENSLFNVYAHLKMFYVSKKGTNLNKRPISTSYPAPWLVFYNK